MKSPEEEFRRAGLYALSGQEAFDPETLSLISSSLNDSSSQIQRAGIVSLMRMKSLPDSLFNKVYRKLQEDSYQLDAVALELLSYQEKLPNCTIVYNEITGQAAKPLSLF